MVRRLHKSYLIMLLSSDTPHTKIHGKSSVRFLFERVDLNFYPFMLFGSIRVFIIKTGLARFFGFWLGFFWFDSVFFPVFFLVWVWLGFFSFRLIKPKPNRTEPVGFFKILFDLIGFFFTVRFFQLFFLFS